MTLRSKPCPLRQVAPPGRPCFAFGYQVTLGWLRAEVITGRPALPSLTVGVWIILAKRPQCLPVAVLLRAEAERRAAGRGYLAGGLGPTRMRSATIAPVALSMPPVTLTIWPF